MVLDASALLEWLLRTPTGLAVEAHVFSRRVPALAAPHLIDLEIAQVLRRWVAAGRLTAPRAALALQACRDLRLRRYPHTDLLPRIWALRGNATAYDAAYLALAEALGAELVTCDRGLAAVPGTRARVRVLPPRGSAETPDL